MSAYAAVVSLSNTIERILDSSRFSLVPPSPEILEEAGTALRILKRILERLDRRSKSKSRKRVNALDDKIKGALWGLEDLLEHHLSHQILSQSGGERDSSPFSIDLRSLRGDVDSFIKTIKDLKKKYVYEIKSMPQVEDDEWVVSSINDVDGMKPKMLELFSDLYSCAKDFLTFDSFNIFCFRGMAGSGKTVLAKRLFDDPDISRLYNHRVWVRVGRRSELGEIARHILAEVDPDIDKTTLQGDEEIVEVLKERMKGKRCVIVLDDVWDTQVLDSLLSSLPNLRDAKIRILLTTKISQDNHLRIHDSRFLAAESWTMRPLSLEESEDLLREKVFGEGHDIPPHLREAAKKIAKRCGGLPLMIVTVADLLNNTDAQYWDDVAEKRNSVLRDASNQIAKVLFPVYDCFPQHLKMFFLYVGAFPEDSELLSSKLKHLLDAEGLLEEHTLSIILRYDLNNFGFENNIVSIEPNKVTGFTLKYSYTINAFWRLLFNNVASGDKFLHVVDSSFNSSEDGVIKGQRRLCLHSNFLFNFKAVHHSVKRDCASNARSLLCFGPYHQYSMPLDVGFKLLRVLDAVKVRFYMFPIEIVNLVQLQYLGLSYNGKLPTSISKLFNLQFLIIHPHVSIKSFGAPSCVPVQIWDMQELKHVDILGSNLPNPDSNATLKKLSTLLGVSPNSCTREVLERIPKLRKLGIQIELTPQYDQAMSRVFLPDNLDTFKCSILNPEVKEGLVAPLTPLSVVPQTLRKLHLSGLGYPWKYMKMIGSLPKLEVLKLRCYAFRGLKWESKMKSFRRLKLLVIEDSDLVHWIPLGGSFPRLEQLSLKHCYKLQNLHWPNDGGMIELVDCSPLAVACAEQLKRKTRKGHLDVIASFDDDELQRIYPN